MVALEESEQLAIQTKDYIALSDLEMLRSIMAVRGQDLSKAFTHAQKARDLSLRTVHPIMYTTSSIAMSEIANLRNDRYTAYEVLAVGWVTLGDLMGSEIAKNTFAPKLRKLVEMWGKEEFFRIKKQYEECRKAARTTKNK